MQFNLAAAFRYFPWLAAGAAVLVLGASVYVSTLTPALPAELAALPAFDPAAMAAAYRTSLAELTQELAPLLERELTSADLPQVNAVHNRLLLLTVPRAAQAHHLELTLALGRLRELLKPGAVVVAAKQAPGQRAVQAELKKLISAID